MKHPLTGIIGGLAERRLPNIVIRPEVEALSIRCFQGEASVLKMPQTLVESFDSSTIGRTPVTQVRGIAFSDQPSYS